MKQTQTGGKRLPLRQCVGCGEMKEKRSMCRVIRTPEGALLIDTTGRKNGRGAYICADAECLKRAEKSRGLERSLKMQIPPEVYESLEEAMKQNHGQ